MTQVFFSRPKYIPSVIFKMLRSIGFQAVDMHFHTQYSMDAVSDIRSVLKRCRDKGYGVAVTDHNEVAGAVKAWKMQGNVFVIPGMEASTKEGVHALTYFHDISDCRQFYEEVVKPLKRKNPFFLPISIENLVIKAKAHNAIIGAPHPFGPGKIGIKKIKVNINHYNKYDFIEGLNGANLRKMNKKAISWAKHIHKGMCAGSDGHLTSELGNNMTLAYGYDIESFLLSVKKGYNMILGKEMNMLVDFFHQLVKEKNYFKRARELGKGGMWIKEHTITQEKLKELYRNYELLHQQKRMLNRKYYLKIGEELFK